MLKWRAIRMKKIVEGAVNSLKISIGAAQDDLIALRNKRMEICKGCDFRDKLLERCKKCGCFLKMKTASVSSSCPINEW
jgi:hypothetical protein